VGTAQQPLPSATSVIRAVRAGSWVATWPANRFSARAWGQPSDSQLLTLGARALASHLFLVVALSLLGSYGAPRCRTAGSACVGFVSEFVRRGWLANALKSAPPHLPTPPTGPSKPCFRPRQELLPVPSLPSNITYSVPHTYEHPLPPTTLPHSQPAPRLP
jgi:hypothetical protein